MFNELPREILADIFRRLGFEDRYVTVRLVCKAWSHAATDAACWPVANLEECFRSRLSVRFDLQFQDKIDAMVKNLVDWSRGGLVQLHLRCCSDAAIVYAAAKCPRLQVLSIKDCPSLTGLALVSIATSCRDLRELDVSGTTSVSAASIQSFKQCTSLVRLRRNYALHHGPLAPVPRVGRSTCAAIGDAMPGLEMLELRNCFISDAELQSLVDRCRRLRHLDLRGCQGLSNAAVEAAASIVASFERPLPNLSEEASPGSRYGHWQLYSQRFLF